MSDLQKPKKIKILKNGPYIVTGKIELKEKIITPVGKGYKFVDGKEYPLKDTYSLCRCGKSKDKPFCDGEHVKEGFIAKERASKEDYLDRAKIYKGKELYLADDGRCAFARFCHTNKGSVWELLSETNDEEKRDLAIKGAKECPTGRLMPISKEGIFYEDEHEPMIIVLQDPEKNVSSGLFVRGGVDLENEDSFVFERRNRYVICRCGRSRNKPFCDAMHVVAKFDDSK